MGAQESSDQQAFALHPSGNGSYESKGVRLDTFREEWQSPPPRPVTESSESSTYDTVTAPRRYHTYGYPIQLAPSYASQEQNLPQQEQNTPGLDRSASASSSQTPAAIDFSMIRQPMQSLLIQHESQSTPTATEASSSSPIAPAPTRPARL